MKTATAKRAPRILLTGGGTGGHVYPAIAIADAIRRLAPEAVIEFAGTRERMEWQAVPKAGYTIHPITVSALHRGKITRNLAFPFKLARGLAESRKLVSRFAPDVVVGTGGYVSGPVLLLASLMGRPIVIQEQNAHAGLTNRLLSKRARRIHVAFPEVMDQLPEDRCVLSGNPTRAELLEAKPEEARRFYEVPDGPQVLLVFGGSLGSRAINDAIEHHLPELLEDENLFIIWQTGALYYDSTAARVEHHPRLRVLKYIDQMGMAYAAADLVLCRAGAITCSELLVTETPSILVPSPNVAADHQTRNARSMADAGAAVLLPEPELEARLTSEVQALLGDEARREAMARAAAKLARPDAAERIAKDVLELAGASD